MNQGQNDEESLEKPISRRRFVIILGFIFAAIIGILSMLKEAGKKTISSINRFRIRSIESTPDFDPETWTLTIDGLVENPLEITYKELLELEKEEQVRDFHCVEGWSVDDVKWKGIRLEVIFEMVKPTSEAVFATFHSSSGIYSDSLSIKEALEPDVMLAYMLNDEFLPEAQGRPLRLVMPRMFGYKNVKWVNRITLTKPQETGYWEKRGYNIDGVSYR